MSKLDEYCNGCLSSSIDGPPHNYGPYCLYQSQGPGSDLQLKAPDTKSKVTSEAPRGMGDALSDRLAELIALIRVQDSPKAARFLLESWYHQEIYTEVLDLIGPDEKTLTPHPIAAGSVDLSPTGFADELSYTNEQRNRNKLKAELRAKAKTKWHPQTTGTS